MTTIKLKNRTLTSDTMFKDLPIGDWFYDFDGELCIKLNNALGEDNTHLIEKKYTYTYRGTKEVTPVSTITIAAT